MGVSAAIVEGISASSAWSAQKKMIDDSCGPVPKPKVKKCPSCGSREFRDHNMVCICAYCRSEV